MSWPQALSATALWAADAGLRHLHCGFHLAELLLQKGLTVHGFDAMTDYCDVALKRDRHAILCPHMGFTGGEKGVQGAV